jgi:hypothetical protein
MRPEDITRLSAEHREEYSLKTKKKGKRYNIAGIDAHRINFVKTHTLGRELNISGAKAGRTYMIETQLTKTRVGQIDFGKA